MQTTMTTIKSKKLAVDLATMIGIALAVALFVVTIGRMGFLSFGGATDATASGQRLLVTDEFQFAQRELHLQVGETVTFQLENRELLAHSFDVDAFNVHAPMPGKERTTVTFTPTQAGTYTFYCGVPGHQAAGMSGTLIVTDP